MPNPIHVAIVGAGPAGFYAAEALTRQPNAGRIDIYERLPTPYGLVRYGVAPDHPKLKSVTRVFDRIAGHEGVRFIGNVDIGRDVSLDELQKHYHAVLIATGVPDGRKPGLPGEDLDGSTTAADFVGWYNGHPDHQHHHFDLSGQHAVVIGNGNVALDVARILLRDTDELAKTDITTNALQQLKASNITDVHVIGRRGPINVSFSNKELREFSSLAGVTPLLNPADLTLTDEESAALDADKQRTLVFKSLTGFSERSADGSERRCHFHFFQSPEKLIGASGVQSIVLKSNRPDHPTPDPIDCKLVVYSIGYGGESISNVGIDPATGIVPNDNGQVLNNDNVVPGLFVTGWARRGPTGVIGTNKADAVEVVELITENAAGLPQPENDSDLLALLNDRGVQTVSYAQWEEIHQAEQANGKHRDSPAEKFCTVKEMLGAIG